MLLNFFSNDTKFEMFCHLVALRLLLVKDNVLKIDNFEIQLYLSQEVRAHHFMK